MMRFEQRRAALLGKKAQKLENKHPNIAELKKSLSEKLTRLAADLEKADEKSE